MSRDTPRTPTDISNQTHARARFGEPASCTTTISVQRGVFPPGSRLACLGDSPNTPGVLPPRLFPLASGEFSVRMGFACPAHPAGFGLASAGGFGGLSGDAGGEGGEFLSQLLGAALRAGGPLPFGGSH